MCLDVATGNRRAEGVARVKVFTVNDLYWRGSDATY